MTQRNGLQQCMDALASHFGAQMFQLDSKMARICKALDLLDDRCGNITKAVKQWEWSDVEWVTLPKEKGDAEIVAAFRMVEQFNNQFDNLKVTYAALADRKDHQPKSFKDGIMKTSDSFEMGSLQQRLDKAKHIVAVGMVTNTILTSTTPKDKSSWPSICNKVIKHLKEKMQYDMTKLPSELLPILATEGCSKKGGSDSAAGKASASSAASSGKAFGSGSSASTAKQEVAQDAPQKKVRRFGKTAD